MVMLPEPLPMMLVPVGAWNQRSPSDSAVMVGAVSEAPDEPKLMMPLVVPLRPTVRVLAEEEVSAKEKRVLVPSERDSVPVLLKVMEGVVETMVILPVAPTWKASEVPEVKVPETSKLQVRATLPLVKARAVSVLALLKVQVKLESAPKVVVPISVVSRLRVTVSVAETSVSIPLVPPATTRVLPWVMASVAASSPSRVNRVPVIWGTTIWPAPLIT